MAEIKIAINKTVYVDVSTVIHKLSTEDMQKEIDRRNADSVLKSHEGIIRQMGEYWSTEQIKEVYDFIVGSYHFDVFKGELDETVDSCA